MRIPAVTGTSYVRAGDLEVYASLRDEAGAAFRTAFQRGVAPLATALLVGVQIRLYWAIWVPEVYRATAVTLPKLTTAILENGEVWRLFTMGFYHEGIGHLFMNMLFLAFCGWNLERALGPANVLVLYFASVLGGSLLSMYGTPDAPAIGASGGVFGMIAAVTVFGLLRAELLTARSRLVVGIAILPYLVGLFASGLVNEATDNLAHFGGLVTGGLLGVVLDPPGLQRRRGWNRRWHAGVGTACIAIPVLLGLLGPRIHPLRDADDVAAAFSRRPLPPREEAYRSLVYRVPVGWAPASLSTGDFGAGSTAGLRGVVVVESTLDAPSTPDDVLSTWLTRVREAWPDAAAGPPTDATLAGLPARA
ncbi:MAG: rhomboid family intramembrane serine protease, partial [Deltaproteobacteria bacterium]|nr:rhomboid family intramembrane serine protease [Deltaproteobacteria bacterium]